MRSTAGTGPGWTPVSARVMTPLPGATALGLTLVARRTDVEVKLTFDETYRVGSCAMSVVNAEVRDPLASCDVAYRTSGHRKDEQCTHHGRSVAGRLSQCSRPNAPTRRRRDPRRARTRASGHPSRRALQRSRPQEKGEQALGGSGRRSIPRWPGTSARVDVRSDHRQGGSPAVVRHSLGGGSVAARWAADHEHSVASARPDWSRGLASAHRGTLKAKPSDSFSRCSSPR